MYLIQNFQDLFMPRILTQVTPYWHPTHLGQWWTRLLLIEVILLRLLLKEAEAKHH